MELSLLFQQLAIALGLGFLVGLQRESVDSPLAGIRTFPLITIFGTICAWLGQTFGGWIVGIGIVALAALIFVGNKTSPKEPLANIGLTTEIAMLLMYAIGAYVVIGQREIAIALGGGVAVLLQFKGPLHRLVDRLGEKELKAIMQFVLISLVILPVLPNRTFGPYDVLNPRNIWLMVVLIVGISLGGYIIYKFFGQNAGIVLGGVLGGLISSTATTVSYARRAKTSPESSPLAALVILIASAIVFGRLLLEIALVAPRFLLQASLPLLLLLLTMGVFSFFFWLRHRTDKSELPPQENPTELKPAIFFGLLYGLILFVVAAVKERFGTSGLYVVAAISGLTDVDAITLSTSQLVNAERLSAEQGWRIILIAALSNLVFKTGAVALLGNRQLFMKVGAVFGAIFVLGVLLIFLLPG
jgi:uncharacterized membrane protein (DUF4010 family)